MYYAVIMAGGSGTRLWPLSRQSSPKQALKLVGDKTMFQYAVERIRPVFPLERIFVVTKAQHAPILIEQIPELPAGNFILEPEGRGTAPAIGLAAIHLKDRDPNAVMAVLTADHFITDTEEFYQVLGAAESVATDGSLVTLGIQPSSASTGFGYIQQGPDLGEKMGFKFFAVQRFIEKPDPTSAGQMVKSGDYSWNSGMFAWRVDRIVEEFRRQMPEFYAQLAEVEAMLGAPGYEPTLKRVWPRVAKQTIDYGVMEEAENVAVIPVDIGWSDVGSWANLPELLPSDEVGNVAVGQHVGIDTRDMLVFAGNGNRLIATIGVEGLVIVDTEDALLICAKGREQDVRAMVKRLEEMGCGEWL
jgi:mannose-1-phosphate guanylyltransferase